MFTKRKIVSFFILCGAGFLMPMSFVSAACLSAVPPINVTINPPVADVAIGIPVIYTVTVTNNDTDDGALPACGSKNFNLSESLSSGLNLSSGFATNPLDIYPVLFPPIFPNAKSTTFEITSDAIGLDFGNYTFTVTATDGTYTESATAIYNITAIDVEICNNDDEDDDGDGFADCDDTDCLSDPFCCGDGSVDGAEICDTNLPISCADPTPVCLNDCTGCVAELPGCVIGTGNCDGIAANGCETDLFSDTFNCGSCGNKCRAGYCTGGKCPSLLHAEEGIIPCGRLVDDPSTEWIELQPCTICHIIILFSEIINLLMELVALITILAMIVAGLIYIKAGGNMSLILAAKQNINKVLLGFIIVFIAWVIVNVSMMLFGFNDPLGDGSWKKLNCDLEEFAYCGDSIVQNPNGLGEIEECEAGETLADYTARKIAMAVGCVDGDGNCPDGCFSDAGVSTDDDCDIALATWAVDVSRCNSSCKIACKNDPLASKIGGGCFLATNPCQKGRYACDLEGGGVSCLDIYGDPKFALSPWYLASPLFDYCCESMSWDLSDGDFMVSPSFTPFTVERATWFPFHCEDVCAAVGKVCVGVGLTNPVLSSCIYVIHDIGGGCDLPSNNAATNCSATFSRRNPCDCTSGGKCFGVRETACYCAF